VPPHTFHPHFKRSVRLAMGRRPRLGPKAPNALAILRRRCFLQTIWYSGTHTNISIVQPLFKHRKDADSVKIIDFNLNK